MHIISKQRSLVPIVVERVRKPVGGRAAGRALALIIQERIFDGDIEKNKK